MDFLGNIGQRQVAALGQNLNLWIVTDNAKCAILTKIQIDRSLQLFELEERSSNQKTSIFYEKSENQHLGNI